MTIDAITRASPPPVRESPTTIKVRRILSGSTAWLSTGALAERTGSTRGTALSACRRLRAAGLVECRVAMVDVGDVENAREWRWKR